MLDSVRGKLFVLATPLGNLGDLSSRALTILRSVDWIACEDTRRTAKLLARFGVERPSVSYHRFNEARRTEALLALLREGRQVALVSDGGTPGVADPGARLVRAVHAAGIEVSPIPGPAAVTALLSASGLDGDRFVFDGFLPPRAGERRRRLRELRAESRTVVFYEAPHRLRSTLRDVATVFGPRPLVLGRELTKLHETILVGSAEELLDRLGTEIRGEITIAVHGAEAGERVEDTDTEARKVLDCWNRLLGEHAGDRRAALREAARELGMKRAELQRRLAELRA
jgi:16S rRNA (cytidine1402-2'-O)-methyltransferase